MFEVRAGGPRRRGEELRRRAFTPVLRRLFVQERVAFRAFDFAAAAGSTLDGERVRPAPGCPEEEDSEESEVLPEASSAGSESSFMDSEASMSSPLRSEEGLSSVRLRGLEERPAACFVVIAVGTPDGLDMNARWSEAAFEYFRRAFMMSNESILERSQRNTGNTTSSLMLSGM